MRDGIVVSKYLPNELCFNLQRGKREISEALESSGTVESWGSHPTALKNFVV